MRVKRLFAILCLVTLLAGCFSPENPSSIPEEGEGYHGELTPLILDDGTTPVTANIRSIDIDGDGSNEVVFTEPIQGRIGWIEMDCIQMECEDPVMIEDLGAPVRVAVTDLDNDTQPDIIVADIGILYPTNEKQGRVLAIEGNQTTVLIDGLGSTVCAEPGDFDGDGDEDLTLCEFGHDNGSVSWLEHTDSGEWTQHILDPRPGSIHAVPVDVDSDGDLDIVAIISQNAEEIMLYRNNGTGDFTSESLFDSNLTYFGMSGLRVGDLDMDGDSDIVFTNGDTMDGDIPENVDPNALHGAAWLENDGLGVYIHHDLVRAWGTYDTLRMDYDGDGDSDLIVVCMQMDGQFPEDTPREQVIVLEADGGEWIHHPFSMDGNSRILTLENARGDIVVGSHDPLDQGGELYRLARLDLLIDGGRWAHE